jgi:phenylpropionate dioxygenase-like ring-hydroxylating dioxygenase large terminal subunit
MDWINIHNEEYNYLTYPSFMVPKFLGCVMPGKEKKMIPNQWYGILESKEVKLGKPVGVTRMGEKLVFWRDTQGQVTCQSDLCPHRGVALSAGKLQGDCIQCPFHGFEYDSTGHCQLIPANGKKATPPKALQVRTYPAREAHDLIYIWWGEPRAEYPELPWFDSLHDNDFSYFTIRDHWTNHYSRAIENQLDVVHLPFVHHNTIGRENKALVNGPRMKVEEREGRNDILNIWFDNEVDQGQTPIRADKLPEPQTHPLLQFCFPNIWQNWLGDKLRILIVFAPIDHENTLMYIRQYQSIVNLPLLRETFNLMGAIGNLIIERQDKRVVVTQRPKRTELRMEEKLIPGDGPIIEYRRRREALIEADQEWR